MRAVGIILGVVVAGLAAYVLWGLFGGTAQAATSNTLRDTAASNANARQTLATAKSASQAYFKETGDSGWRSWRGSPTAKVRTDSSGTTAKVSVGGISVRSRL